MRKYVNIGMAAVLVTELGMSAVFQLGLHHPYPQAGFGMAAFFFALAILFGLGVGKFYPEGLLNNKRYALYKGIKSLVCLAIAVLLVTLIQDRGALLELLIRFAVFYIVQLALETWEMLDYQRKQTTNKQA